MKRARTELHPQERHGYLVTEIDKLGNCSGGRIWLQNEREKISQVWLIRCSLWHVKHRSSDEGPVISVQGWYARKRHRTNILSGRLNSKMAANLYGNFSRKAFVACRRSNGFEPFSMRASNFNCVPSCFRCACRRLKADTLFMIAWKGAKLPSAAS